MSKRNRRVPKETFELGFKDCLQSENFLDEGKLVGGGSAVSCRYLIFKILGIMQKYCRRLLVLPDTSIYCTFS